MALQDVFDPAIESLDHAVCLRSHWWCETMLDAEMCAELVELMPSRARTNCFVNLPVAFVGTRTGKKDLTNPLLVLSYKASPTLNIYKLADMLVATQGIGYETVCHLHPRKHPPSG